MSRKSSTLGICDSRHLDFKSTRDFGDAQTGYKEIISKATIFSSHQTCACRPMYSKQLCNPKKKLLAKENESQGHLASLTCVRSFLMHMPGV